MASSTRYPNPEARRAAVKAALDQHGRLTMAQRRVLAEQFGCTVAAVNNDVVRLTP